MIFNSLAYTLLAAAALLYMLTKVRNGEHGSLLKWITWLLLLVAIGSIAWQVTRGVRKYYHRHHGEKHHEMSCGPGSSHGMKNNCMMHHGMEAHHDCGPGKMRLHEMESDSIISETSTDTVDGKVIHKEMKIIRNTKP